MTIDTSNEFIIGKRPARATVTAGRPGPTPLTETELDRVAAAGSKPGIGSGTNEKPPPRPA